MHITWPEIARGLGEQASFSAGYSPLYAEVFETFAAWARAQANAEALSAEGAAFVRTLETAWQARGVSGGLHAALLLAAGVHAAVLTDDPAAAHLGAYYATIGGTYDPAQDGPGLRAALGALFAVDSEAVNWFLREADIQTNEPGRGIGWLLPAQVFASWQPGLSFTLVDLGTSAGLNLAADQHAWEWHIGARRVVFNDQAPIMTQTIHPEAPDDPNLGAALPGPIRPPPDIRARVGIDRQPLDIFDETTHLVLQACIWGDQPERIARLEAAQAGYQALLDGPTPPQFFAGDITEAARLLPRLLPQEAEPPHLMLVYNSAVTTYFSDVQYDRLRRTLVGAFNALPPGVAGVWLENEPPRYNESAERPKYFGLRARVGLFGGVSSFFLGELEAHPQNLYLRAGWDVLREALGW